MASLIRKHAEGILDESGLTYFTGMLDQVDTSRGQLAFLAEASAFAAIVKSGSVAGTRGDPVGVVATHNDGSRWRKVGIGKWARVGADQKQKSPDNQKPKDVDSVRVTALRARLKQLKREWHAASSASQRADVVGKLRAVKAAIRKMSGRARVKKSEVPDILPFADKVFANILEELEVCGEVRYVPDHVVASLRRNLHRHRRDLCNTDPILAEVMRDIAAGLPVDSDAVRELGYVAKSSLEVLSGVGGPDFAEWAKSTVPAATMKQSDIADTVRNMHQLTVSMKSIDHYVEDTNEFDPLGRLTAGDYIARIHKDGGTAARDLFTARMVKGAEFVADHITQKLEELR